MMQCSNDFERWFSSIDTRKSCGCPDTHPDQSNITLAYARQGGDISSSVVCLGCTRSRAAAGSGPRQGWDAQLLRGVDSCQHNEYLQKPHRCATVSREIHCIWNPFTNLIECPICKDLCNIKVISPAILTSHPAVVLRLRTELSE